MPTDVVGAPEARLVALYRKLALDLQMLMRLGAAGASDPFIDAQLRALGVELGRLGDTTAAWSAREASDAYRRSASAAAATLKKSRLPVTVAGFTGVDKRAVNALAQRMTGSLAQYREALGRGLVLSDPRIGAKAVRQAIAGENKLVDADGRVQVGQRKWMADAYASTVARTGIADVRREAFRERYVQNGYDVVVVVANGSDHDDCQRWEGQRLSLTGMTEGLPTPDDAEADGLFHPNCRHRYVVDPTWPLPDEGQRDATRAAAEEEDAQPEDVGSRRPTESRLAVPVIPVGPPALPPVSESINPGAVFDQTLYDFYQVPEADRAAIEANGSRHATSRLEQNLPLNAQVFLRDLNFTQAQGSPEANVTADVRIAVENYTGPWYGPINRSLRRQQPADNETLGNIKGVDRAFAIVPPLDREAIVWRGVLAGGEATRQAFITKVQGLKVGDTLDDPAFNSWSVDRHIAEEFGSSAAGATIFRLRIPAGTKALYMGTAEHEVLLQRGRKYRVVAEELDVQLTAPGMTFEPSRPKRVLTLELVNQGESPGSYDPHAL